MADTNATTIKINWMKLLTWALMALLAVSWYVAEGYIGRVQDLEVKAETAEKAQIKADGRLALALQAIEIELKQMRIDNSRGDSLIWTELRKR